MGKTLFHKIWEEHVVSSPSPEMDVLYIDSQLIHEVTSPQAFAGIEKRGLSIFRPQQIVATVDHNIPTVNQHLPIQEPLSRQQVQRLTDNCTKHAIPLYGLGNDHQGIVHVIGPELGFTLPGMTIVCGDSHTSTHGAFGCIAFGIGTSEVEQVFASQCMLQSKPKVMKVEVNGELKKGVTAKDVILYIIAQLSASGATGYFVEFSGSTIRTLSMEGRMTVCNMSIEMGARGGLIQPDEKTIEYLKGKPFAPKGKDFDNAVAYWKTLVSDADALFDSVLEINAADIEPMLTFGTNPGMGVKVTQSVPSDKMLSATEKESYSKALQYMGFSSEEKIAGKKIEYVFIGSCTNSRIEDLRDVARMVKGKKKASHVAVWVVPGSQAVSKQAIGEGLDKIFTDAGFEFRQAGCSACLAMNDDKIPEGKYCVSTSNRNFEGRQGQGARTILASPLTAAACALTGYITDVRTLLQ
jgi:3-isopropylmalate/(R)-2-methylmalate dehydratase large subunit